MVIAQNGYRFKGIHASIHGGPKTIAAPFGAVSWKSDDWYQSDAAEKTRSQQLRNLLKARIRQAA